MKIVGHRGARGLAPENTIAALNKGLEHHVDELEFDLRVTKDNVVVLHHDEFITDPNGQKHTIKDLPFSELKEHKTDLATFIEVLDTISKKVVLYVEVKPDVNLKPVIAIIRDYYERGWHNLKLASFAQEILLELHKIFPEIPTIVLEKWSGVRAHLRMRQLNTKYVGMDQKWLWWGFIWSVNRRGWKLYTYTLNDPVKAKKWSKYGLYAVVTDYPDLFDKM
jgi:glycerophosphoryl diester phosphodiesterase